MKKSNGKVLAFMRKNAVYLVLALCILAVGLSITFMLIEKNSGDITANIPDDQPTVNTPIVPDAKPIMNVSALNRFLMSFFLAPSDRKTPISRVLSTTDT